MRVSYQVDGNSSFERLIEIVQRLRARCVSVEVPSPLMANWDALLTTLRQRRDERDEVRSARITVAAVVDVADARLDEAFSLLSGNAFLAAGRDAKKAPYANLFGTVTAVEAQRLGPPKATVYAAGLIAKLKELDHPQLNSFVPRIERLAGELKKADAERAEFDQALAMHEIRRQRAVSEVEALIAMTGLYLAERFPEQPQLVAAVLNPYPHRAKRKRVAPAEQEESGDISSGDQEPQLE